MFHSLHEPQFLYSFIQKPMFRLFSWLLWMTMWWTWMGVWVQIPLQNADFIPFEFIPRYGLTGSHGNSSPNFWETSTLFSIVTSPICILISSGQGFLFSTSPPTFTYCLCDNSYFNRCEVIDSSLWFRFAFPWRSAMFSYTVGHLYVYACSLAVCHSSLLPPSGVCPESQPQGEWVCGWGTGSKGAAHGPGVSAAHGCSSWWSPGHT